MATPSRPDDPALPSLERQATTVGVVAYRAGSSERREDRLTGEEPMAIRACGPGQEAVDVAVTMRTPGHEAELAVGFLVTEGLLEDSRVVDVTFADAATSSRPDDEVTVHLDRP